MNFQAQGNPTAGPPAGIGGMPGGQPAQRPAGGAASNDPPQNPANWYYAWGMIHVFMAMWGFLINLWYPNNIKRNTWWLKQCPTTHWTTATATTAAGVALSATVAAQPTTAGSATLTAVNNTWNQSQCLQASPIRQWNYLSWTMMIGYGVTGALWIFNSMAGNNGKFLHMVWLTIANWASLLSIATLTLTFLAQNSYGSQQQVYQSWFGYKNIGYQYPDSGAGNLTVTYSGLVSSTWTSDLKYLIWNSPAPTWSNRTDYSLVGNMLYFASDSNYIAAFFVTVALGFLDILIYAWSWRAFSDYYKKCFVWNLRQQQIAETQNTFNNEGCNQLGKDKDGNTCPAVSTF